MPLSYFWPWSCCCSRRKPQREVVLRKELFQDSRSSVSSDSTVVFGEEYEQAYDKKHNIQIVIHSAKSSISSLLDFTFPSTSTEQRCITAINPSSETTTTTSEPKSNRASLRASWLSDKRKSASSYGTTTSKRRSLMNAISNVSRSIKWKAEFPVYQGGLKEVQPAGHRKPSDVFKTGLADGWRLKMKEDKIRSANQDPAERELINNWRMVQNLLMAASDDETYYDNDSDHEGEEEEEERRRQKSRQQDD